MSSKCLLKWTRKDEEECESLPVLDQINFWFFSLGENRRQSRIENQITQSVSGPQRRKGCALTTEPTARG